MIHIVLVEPEIPQNTGNIARTCAATGSELHLVKPLGYSLEDKYLKRAGLDYWPLVRVHVHENFGEVLAAYPDAPFFMPARKRRKAMRRSPIRRTCFSSSAGNRAACRKTCWNGSMTAASASR